MNEKPNGGLATLIRRGARWALVLSSLVFVYAGAVKIGNAAAFSSAVSNYSFLPTVAVRWVAMLVPWLEVVAGASFLFLPAMRSSAVAIQLALLAAFVVALAWAFIRGDSGACGCFGTANTIGLISIGRAAAMLMVVGAAAVASTRLSASQVICARPFASRSRN